MKNEKRTLLLTSLVCLIPMIVGALVYKRLPESMATHFGLDGTPNGWSGRAFAVFGLPGILLAVNLLMPFLLRADPKHENMSSALKTVAIWSIPLISLICSGATLGYGLGYDLRIERILPILMGVLLVVIGNYLPKTKQSYTMGIKLPWTLASEENWNRTHRLAGFLWVIGGILLILLTLLRLWNTWTFLLVIIPMSVVPMIYSYLLYRKGI